MEQRLELETLELETWIFLVSANFYLDYRTVIAPDFMCNSKTTRLLAQKTESDLTENKIAYINDSEKGNLTIVFRVREATSKDLSIENEDEDVLKDSFGREIFLTEGLVIKGNFSKVKLTRNLITEIHKEIKTHYSDFWEWITPRPAIASVSQTRELEVKRQQNSKSIENQIKLKQLGHYQINNKIPWSQNSEITSVTFIPDNPQRIVVRHEKKQTVEIFNIIDSTIKPTNQQKGESDNIKAGGCPTPAKISPDGRYIVTAQIEEADQNKVKLFSIDSQSIKPRIKGEFGQYASSRIRFIDFLNDQKLLIISGESINLWEINNNIFLEIKPEKRSNSGEITSLSVSESRKYIAIGTKKGIIEIWKLNHRLSNPINDGDKKEIKAHGTPNEAPINSLAFNPKDKKLASAGDDYKIFLWDPDTGNKEEYIGEHDCSVNVIVFSPDGNFLASGDDKGSIKLWNMKAVDQNNRYQNTSYREHNKAVTSLSFSPDSKTLVSGSKDGNVIVWNIENNT